MIGASLKSKILRNLSANAYGQSITILTQLVSVPLYLRCWGVTLYGEWLILSTIPAYLALSDIGFATVAANDMTMRVARDDRLGALEVYQSIWVFICSISVLLGTALTIIIYTFPLTAYLSINNIGTVQTQKILVILILYALLGLQGGVLNAAFRAAGFYAYGTAMINTVRLVEWTVAMIGLLLGRGVLAIALFNLIARLMGMMIIWLELRRQVQWLHLGTRAASFQQIRKLLKPATAFMAFPLGLAFSLQGMILIIGMTLGSTAVVIFSAYRTLTRLLVQTITTLNQAAWPEISAAYGSKKMDLVMHLHRKGSSFAFWIAVVSVTLIAITGEWLIGIWTHHTFENNHILLILLLLTSSLNVLWQTSWVVLMATNQHQTITIYFIFSSACTLILAAVIIPMGGINSIGVILAFAELFLLYTTINITLPILNDYWPSYLKSILKNPLTSYH